MQNLKDDFLLNPEVVFLNHGSFGACPRPVLEEFHRWHYAMEHQPVDFLGRSFIEMMARAREGLADYLGCQPGDLVYFPNPTTAINMVLKSLALSSGDEILTTNHEYGAMDRSWQFYCRKSGARYVRVPIPLPVTTPEEFIEKLWSGVNRRTRLIFISHITSPTALEFPVAEICRRAREAGILSVVDGAHAPGQISLQLPGIGADFYTGACHKWLCAPKGSAFLYARPAVQEMLEPLVVSWGYEADEPGPSTFIDHHEWQGTRDLAAFLSVPAAIAYQKANNWEQVRARCHQLAVRTRNRIGDLTGFGPIAPAGWFSQMFAVQLPVEEPEKLQITLYDRYGIEIPVFRWEDKSILRCSFQGYNDSNDADALVAALEALINNL